MSAQDWLNQIGDHVSKLHLEKAELEKSLFTIASVVMKEHPEDVNEEGISETVTKILEDYSALKRKIRKLQENPEGAKIWALLEGEEKSIG